MKALRAALLPAAVLLTACTTTRYIPVESAHTRHTYTAAASADTVRVADTVHIIQRGDTVTVRTVHWRDRITLRRDTLRIISTDTVTQVVEVPAALTPWQRIKHTLAGAALLAILLAALLAAAKLRK